MRRTPSRPLVLGALAAGGLLGVVGSAQPWWRARAEGAAVSFSGADATAGLSQALGIVVLVGTLLALALGVRGRRVLAVLLGAAGLGMTAVGALRLAPTVDAVRTRIRQVSLADQFDLVGTAWPWVYAAAGLLTLLAAAALLLAAGRWPARGSRFDRGPAPTVAATPIDLGEDPASAWRALDAGLDPTVRQDDPDVHDHRSEVTMDGKRLDHQAGSSTDPLP